MKKTVQIHIGGRHFHIDEDAFRNLNHYLDSLKSHFASEGETGKEIIEDIEQRIAELLEGKITETKQAISIEDVEQVIATLGKVEDFVYTGEKEETGDHVTYDHRANRRFYRDEESNYIGGVAAGLGAYFDIDPLWFRLAFVGLAFVHGLGVLLYAILWMVVPRARTTAEKLQMRGMPVTLSTIKESVNAEYDKFRSNLDNLSKSGTAERTRNAFENLLRAVGLIFIAIFKFIIGTIGVIFLVLGSIFLAGMILVLLGFTNIFGHFAMWNGIDLPQFSHMFANSGHYYAIVICLVVLVLIPIVALIYWGIKILFNIRSQHRGLRAFVLTAWILALILFITLVILNGPSYGLETSGKQSVRIEQKTYPRIYLSVRDNTGNKRITQYRVFDHRFNYSEWDEALYSKPELSLVQSEDEGLYLSVEKFANNVGMKHSQEFLDRINYHWEQQDSVIYIDRYLAIDDEDFWMFARVHVNLRIPENQVVILSGDVCDLLENDQHYRYCDRDTVLTGKPCIMTKNGLVLQEKANARLNRNN